MKLSIHGEIIPKIEFAYPYRILLSGASGSGKTYLAGKILARPDLFEKSAKRIIYYYPCFIKNRPVKWEEELSTPVSYRIGIPTQEDIDEMQPHTTIVIDDSYDEAVESKAIDHLFRVTSGKNLLNVILMTQNNFAAGKHNRDIKNQCNLSILCRNYIDTRINKRVCQQLGLTKALAAAEADTQFEQYPYFLIDQSPRAFASSYRFYTDIFSEYPVAYSVEGMKGYVINASDFQRFSEVKESARKFEAILKDEDTIKKEFREAQKNGIREKGEEFDSFTDDSSSPELETVSKVREKTRVRRKRKSPEKTTRKNKRRREASPSSESENRSESSSSSSSSDESTDDGKSRRKSRKKYRRSTSRNVRKRQKHSVVLSENSGFSSSE